MKVEPTCRYGHGPLKQVTSKEQIPRWALDADASAETKGVIFTVLLFACPTCGYLELFDEEIDRTKTEESWE